MSRVFKQPEIKEFEQVKLLVNDFWLDDTGLQPQQFQVLSDNGKVIAFGRLREHADATELCTMGVAGEFQKKRIRKGNGKSSPMSCQVRRISCNRNT